MTFQLNYSPKSSFTSEEGMKMDQSESDIENKESLYLNLELTNPNT